ncbi:MAG: SdrD B-like domain-containing protein [Patescibacteria group bacterium]
MPKKLIISTLAFFLTLTLFLFYSSIYYSTASVSAQNTCTDGNIGGVVFRDYDGNGTRASTEPAVSGITVTAYSANDDVVASTTSNATGDYALSVDSGKRVRVEFSGFPSYLVPSPHGSTGTFSDTAVSFATSTDCDVNLGLYNPGEYCDASPTSAIACFVTTDISNPASARYNSDVLVSFPYTAQGQSGDTGYVAPTEVGIAKDLGSIWGLAYQRSTGTMFASSVLRRHAEFGPGGPSAIYELDMSTTPPTPDVFVDFEDLYNITAGTSPRVTALPTAGFTPAHDPEVYPYIGRLSFGDLDLNSTEDELYVTNLYDKTVYRINTNTKALLGSYPIADPGCSGTTDYQPWGLEFKDDTLYVGVTCTAATSGDRADLDAYVLSLNPTTGVLSTEITFDLDFDRGCADSATCAENVYADWQIWSDTYPASIGSLERMVYPQPILSDIEFDSDGSMILGFIDRFGFQASGQNYTTDTNDTTVYGVVAQGDVLRVCNESGTWVLEDDGLCPSSSGKSDQGDQEGPGGGEYYYDDVFNISSPSHRQAAQGGLALSKADAQLMFTILDPVDVSSGGTSIVSNTSGSRVYNYEVYSNSVVFNMGKATGLGDLEFLCELPPLEVGNYIWHDSDSDGIQDPKENPISNVALTLYKGDTVIAKTETDVNGHYYFSDLDPVTDYRICINESNFDVGKPLRKLSATRVNSSSSQGSTSSIYIDSDGKKLSGCKVGVDITTGVMGTNNHSFDFGFGQPDIILKASTQCTPVADEDASIITFDIDVENPGELDLDNVQVFNDLSIVLENLDYKVVSGPSSTHFNTNKDFNARKSNQTLLDGTNKLGQAEQERVSFSIKVQNADNTYVPDSFSNFVEVTAKTPSGKQVDDSLNHDFKIDCKPEVLGSGAPVPETSGVSSKQLLVGVGLIWLGFMYMYINRRLEVSKFINM